MADDATRNELVRLRAHLATQQARIDRLERRPRRLVPLALVALLVALLPLSLLAAGPFTDLNVGSPHNTNIELIRLAGITTGCNPPDNTAYCPHANVTREEMASFLARTAGLSPNPPIARAARLAMSGPGPNNLGSYSANDLVRAASGANRTDVALDGLGTFQTVTQLTLDVPSMGFVLVSGSLQLLNGTGTATMRLRDPSTGSISSSTTSPELTLLLGATGGRVEQGSLSQTYLFPVTATSKRTYLLEIQSTGTPLTARSAAMAALYTPFGSDGTVFFEVAQP